MITLEGDLLTKNPSVISQNTNGPSQYNFSYILIIHAKELFLFLQTNSMIYLDLILIYLDLIARYKVWSDPISMKLRHLCLFQFTLFQMIDS